jgi:hypothetical protein
MNTGAISYRAPLGSLPTVWRFLRAALSHATGSLIAVAALLGSARVLPILLSYWIRGDSGPPLLALYRLVPSEIAAACMVIAILVAEQCVREGSPRLIAYVLAVAVAALVSGLISMPLILLIHDPRFPITSAHRHFDMLCIALFISTDALARGGLAAFVFANRERWLTSIRRLHEAEIERARIEKNLAESHLLALETRMRPAELISTLEALRSLYERDLCEADRRLSEFIDRLRAMTAGIRI